MNGNGSSEHQNDPPEPSLKLKLLPISLTEANQFVARFHRHHPPVVGHKFSLAAWTDHLCGVAIVGRPVSRMRDDGLTLEITRLCTDGTKNACSFLYGAAAKATHALGYKRVGTYILASENGATLRAANYRLISRVNGRSWSRPSRLRLDHLITDKLLFEAART